MAQAFTFRAVGAPAGARRGPHRGSPDGVLGPPSRPRADHNRGQILAGKPSNMDRPRELEKLSGQEGGLAPTLPGFST